MPAEVAGQEPVPERQHDAGGRWQHDLGNAEQPHRGFPAADDADQIGTSVNRSTIIVGGASLGTAIRDRHAAERHMADAQGRDIAQVRFQNQPVAGELVPRITVEERRQLPECRDERLTEPSGA